jgi:hypothetical protein
MERLYQKHWISNESELAEIKMGGGNRGGGTWGNLNRQKVSSGEEMALRDSIKLIYQTLAISVYVCEAPGFPVFSWTFQFLTTNSSNQKVRMPRFTNAAFYCRQLRMR